MPFKDKRKSRDYARSYMRKLRVQQKGLTIKPDKLNLVKPANVKPEPCQKCQELAILKKENANLQKEIKSYRTIQEQKREYWRQQKKQQREREKVKPKGN